ncbi:small GTP-binding protein, putative [Trichomonas vaginalis G3]|uniref:Small GTP-binding protein, putative n=2 Tax=Trichomonas vaginalis TaxID=5722 RepID=A0A8U0WP29_TRIV3|nr:small Rab GTPase RabX7 [Trichomonas vaginalis]EAX83888.1 small GTP-binding protein, putative [Trichomonas vaginalis G3]|eukprot:XP_001296818.1 small GTP-binding protein [Trichomonas vaginalis G3]
MQESEEIKLVLVGHQYVGKTCIVRMATTGLFDEDTISTLGASYTSKTISIGKKEIRLQIWDTAGQERYRAMTPMYYRGAQVALVVYSVDNIESFKAIDTWIESLQESADPNIIIFVAGNKADLEDSRAVTTQQGEEKAKQHNAIFAEVSAKTGMGVDDLFNTIANTFLEKNRKAPAAQNQQNSVKISESKDNNKKKCC